MIPINYTLTVLIFTGLREGRLLLWSKEETRCKSDSTYMAYFYDDVGGVDVNVDIIYIYTVSIVLLLNE